MTLSLPFPVKNPRVQRVSYNWQASISLKKTHWGFQRIWTVFFNMVNHPLTNKNYRYPSSRNSESSPVWFRNQILQPRSGRFDYLLTKTVSKHTNINQTWVLMMCCCASDTSGGFRGSHTRGSPKEVGSLGSLVGPTQGCFCMFLLHGMLIKIVTVRYRAWYLAPMLHGILHWWSILGTQYLEISTGSSFAS